MGIEAIKVKKAGRKKVEVRWRMRIRKTLRGGFVFTRSGYYETKELAKAAEEIALESINSPEKMRRLVALSNQPILSKLLEKYHDEYTVKKAPTTAVAEKNVLLKVIPNVIIPFADIDSADCVTTSFNPMFLYLNSTNVWEPEKTGEYDWSKATIGITPVGQIRKGHLIAYMKVRKDSGISSGTIKKEIQAISSAFNRMGVLYPQCGALPNPVNLLSKDERPRSGKPRERVPMDAERKLLLDAASKLKRPEMLAIIRLELSTALRRAEVLRIEWQHIDEEKRLIYIPKTKTGRARWVPLNDDALAVMTSLGKKETGKLFNLSAAGVNTAWTRLLAKTGLKGADLTMHDLRHAAITEWAGKGMNVPQIAALSGNADLRNFEHRHGPKLAAFAMARKLQDGGTLNLKDLQSISGHETLKMLSVYLNLDSKDLAERLKGIEGIEPPT